MEYFISKIILSILQKSIVPKFIGDSFTIWSYFELAHGLHNVIETTNSCNELSVSNLKVLSDPLSDAVSESLLRIGNESFRVSKSSSGIYVASNSLSDYQFNNIQFPSYNSGGSGGFNSGGFGGFSSGGSGNFY